VVPSSFEAAHVQIVVIRAAIRELMDQQGVTMKGKYDWLILCEEHIEILVAKTMRVLALRAGASIRSTTLMTRNFQVREVLAKGFRPRPMSPAVGTSPQQAIHHIRVTSLIVTGPFQIPSPVVQCLIAASISQPLQFRLFTGDNNIDIITASQAMVSDRKQRIGVWRQDTRG